VASAVAGTAALAWLARPVGFLSDDWELVDLGPFSWAGVFSTNWYGVAGEGGFYRPVVVLSFYLDRLASGGEAGSFHVTNTLLHGANCLMLFRLAKELFPKSESVALLASSLFCLLPVHTDNVFWIAGRTDTLCALFYMGTLICFLRYTESHHVRWLVLGLIGLLGALFSKEMALSLPGALLALVWFRGKASDPKVYRFLIGALVCYGVYFLVRLEALGALLESPVNTNFSPERILANLATSVPALFGSGVHHLGAVVAALSFFVLLSAYRDRGLLREMALLSGLFLLSMVLVSGLLARWYLYIPSAFANLALAKLWLEAPKRAAFRMAGLAVLAILMLHYGAVLYREGLFWREATRLSEEILDGLAPRLSEQPGRVFLVNLPSAYVPPGAVGDKPLFAYGLEAALRLTGREAPHAPEAVTQVRLTDTAGSITTARWLGDGGLDVECGPGATFSFHSADFVSGRTEPENLTLRERWGELQVIDQRHVRIRIDTREGDTILFYDGRSWSRL
jgi:hypothetical protein